MKWIRRLIGLWLVLGVVAIIYMAMKTPPVRVDIERVTQGPLRVTVDEDGKTRIKERYVISAPLAGRLLRIGINPGDDVKAGETIVATIEPSDPQLLNPRELATAEAREKAAEASLRRAQPLVEIAKAELAFAESELARIRQLADNRSASASALQAAERAYRTSAESYRSANFSQEIASFELAQAKAALMPSRADSSETPPSSTRFQITSPISGRVLRVFRESAAVVTPGLELLEVGDSTDLELEIDILSSDAVRVLPGQEVIVDHWGGEQPLHGVVRLVEPSAFTKISALGVEEQRVNVIIDLTNPVEDRVTLGDGFRVEVKIVVWSSDDVLRVPTSALFKEDEDWCVFRVLDHQARRTRIELGHRNVHWAEVRGDFKQGIV